MRLLLLLLLLLLVVVVVHLQDWQLQVVRCQQDWACVRWSKRYLMCERGIWVVGRDNKMRWEAKISASAHGGRELLVQKQISLQYSAP
jgi:hypothetical protein